MNEFIKSVRKLRAMQKMYPLTTDENAFFKLKTQEQKVDRQLEIFAITQAIKNKKTRHTTET